MMIHYPDYTNCGVNIACSLLSHFGAEHGHATLPFLDGLLKKDYKNIVLMLFDGMGIDVLSRHLSADGFLLQHVAHELSAVFPPTTVAATTSIESGDTPIEHAWLGWTLYFPELDKGVDVFLNTDQCTGKEAADYSVARTIIPYRTLFDRLNATSNVQAYCVSPFGDIRVHTLDDLFSQATRLCRASGKRYIYTYWGEPDHTMHDLGVAKPEIGAILRDIQTRVRTFCEQLNDDTLVLLTADHGLLDTTPLYLCDHPSLTAMLLRRPTVESRAAALYVRPECLADFPAVFHGEICDAYLLIPSEEALARGLFGDGLPHAKAREFLGDFIAIATSEQSLYWSRDDHLFVGMHAGLTDVEMRVPLIVAKR